MSVSVHVRGSPNSKIISPSDSKRTSEGANSLKLRYYISISILRVNYLQNATQFRCTRAQTLCVMSGNDRYLWEIKMSLEAYKWRHWGKRGVINVAKYFEFCQFIHLSTNASTKNWFLFYISAVFVTYLPLPALVRGSPNTRIISLRDPNRRTSEWANALKLW